MEAKEAALRAEYEELQTRMQDPGIFSTSDYPKLAKRQSKLEALISLFDEFHVLRDAKNKLMSQLHLVTQK